VPLGWTQPTFAEYSGYDCRTIGRRTSGESAIPLLVDRHLDLRQAGSTARPPPSRAPPLTVDL
jgi:hypothetical protein